MLRPAWQLLRDAAHAWSEDDASSLGAALAFYTVFSIAPLLLIVVSVAGLLFGEEAARGEIFGQLAGLVGPQNARVAESMLEHLNRPEAGRLGTLVGVAVLLVGATSVFAELQLAMDRVWCVPSRPSARGLWPLVRTRLLSLGMVLGIGFLLIVSLVASAALAAIGKWWAPWFGTGTVRLADAVNFVVSLAFVTTGFAFIYKWMPRARVAWRDVWIGAAVTSMLFTIGKTLIGLYIGRSAVASAFGAAGSLAVLLLWVYYSAQIFLLGAEFTWVYARRHGSLRGLPAAPAAQPAPQAEQPRPPRPLPTDPVAHRLPAATDCTTEHRT